MGMHRTISYLLPVLLGVLGITNGRSVAYAVYFYPSGSLLYELLYLDDSCSERDLGHSFYFYGNPYDTAFVSTNGNVSFGAMGYPGFVSNPFPPSWLPLIAPLLMDRYYYTGITGGIYINPGPQWCAVTWRDTTEYYTPQNKATFQLVLFQDTNVIRCAYGDVDFISWGWTYTARHNVGISAGMVTGKYIHSFEEPDVGELDDTVFYYWPTDPIASDYVQRDSYITGQWRSLCEAGYDTGFGEDWSPEELEQLYDLYLQQDGYVAVDDRTWYYTDFDYSAIGYSVGDHWIDSDGYSHIYLGSGLTTLPEPSSLLLLSAGLVACSLLRKLRAR